MSSNASAATNQILTVAELSIQATHAITDSAQLLFWPCANLLLSTFSAVKTQSSGTLHKHPQ